MAKMDSILKLVADYHRFSEGEQKAASRSSDDELDFEELDLIAAAGNTGKKPLAEDFRSSRNKKD